ncbi:MAG: type II toxin-antitoxin system PemK/MazF family toxin [Nanoarchaeota archaeon]
MERPVKGDVVVLDFPFSDLTQFKKRPALVIKVPKGEDVIICQITAKSQEKEVEIPLTKKDFAKGTLKMDSYLRVDKITTTKNTRINYKVGSLKVEKFKEILDSIVSFLKE